MTDSSSQTEQTQSPTKARRRGLWIFALIVILAASALAAWLWQHRNTLSTQDAYVRANVVQVSADTEGTLARLHVQAGQQVKRGELLAELSAADARLALAQAEANLAKAVRDARGLGSTALAAQSALAQAQANKSAARARVETAQAQLQQSQVYLRRQQALSAQGFVARETLTEAQAAAQGAQGSFQAAQNAVQAAIASEAQAQAQLQTSLAQVDGTSLNGLPEVMQAIIGVRKANLALARTRLLAPMDGVATAPSAQLGQRVGFGDSIVGIVPLSGVWVDANFKETALDRLRVGQPVKLSADAYGSGVVFHGMVAGIEPATGTALSLLPSQNASGNWIKIVQRVPVRIWLDDRQLETHPLQVGLSMQVNVDVSEQSGERLGLLPQASAALESDVFAHVEAEAEAESAKIVDRVLQSSRASQTQALTRPKP